MLVLLHPACELRGFLKPLTLIGPVAITLHLHNVSHGIIDQLPLAVHVALRQTLRAVEIMFGTRNPKSPSPNVALDMLNATVFSEAKILCWVCRWPTSCELQIRKAKPKSTPLSFVQAPAIRCTKWTSGNYPSFQSVVSRLRVSRLEVVNLTFWCV